MTAGGTFPGHVYDGDGDPLSPAAPKLTQATLDAYRIRGAVVASLTSISSDGYLETGRVWVLNQGARFNHIPAVALAEAAGVLDRGLSITLLSRDPKAEASVRKGLQDYHALHARPLAWMAQA